MPTNFCPYINYAHKIQQLHADFDEIFGFIRDQEESDLMSI